MKRRRIEITVETEQVVILQQCGERLTAWCPVCAAIVPVLAAAEADALLELATGAELHFTEMPDGTQRLCLNSLLKTNLITKGEL